LPWLTTTGTDPVGERVWAPPPREMVDAFARLTSALPGVRLYLPRELPQGATLPATWWPVSSGKSPVTWTGSSESNPRVVGRGKNVEVRIVMRIGHGDSWMELAERVKGDLGDLQGDRAGSVAGHEAQIYRFLNKPVNLGLMQQYLHSALGRYAEYKGAPELLERHNDVVHHAVARYRGRSIKSTGDGVLATFDGPARAIRSAFAIRDELGRIDLTVRAGLHAGEIELLGQDIAGIAVHAAARVAALAGVSEVWTSRTVRDLVAGSGLEFIERGEFELKGIPGSWPLFTVD